MEGSARSLAALAAVILAPAGSGDGSSPWDGLAIRPTRKALQTQTATANETVNRCCHMLVDMDRSSPFIPSCHDNRNFACRANAASRYLGDDSPLHQPRRVMHNSLFILAAAL